MSDRCRARVIRVKRDKHGAVLASAAAIGDTVLLVKDAGDLAFDDEAAGTLLVDDDAGTQVTYTDVEYVEDTDQGDLTSPDTVTLSAALAVAIPADTQVWVYEDPDDDPADDGIVSDYVAICVPEDDEDAAELGGRLHASIPPHMQDEFPPGRADARVVLEYDDDTDEWTVLRFRGKARGLRFEADDSYTLTAADITAGAATIPLSHRPIDESLKLWWRTTFQPPTEYTVNASAQTVTMPLGSFVAEGDSIRVHYAYRRGLAPVGVSPVSFTQVGYTVGYGSDATTIAWPAGTQAGDLFIYAALNRTTGRNACADSRATLWQEQSLASPNGVGNTVRIWRGTVASPGTPLTIDSQFIGGASQNPHGLLVIRPERTTDWAPTKVGDSGEHLGNTGSVPGLTGVSGAVGVAFTAGETGGSWDPTWTAPWVPAWTPGSVLNGTYQRIAFATQVATDPAASGALVTSSGSPITRWRGFALGVAQA